MAFDLLQRRDSAQRNLPWIRRGLQCLNSLLPKGSERSGQLPITIAAIEQMTRSAIPDFDLETPTDSVLESSVHTAPPHLPSINPTGTREQEEHPSIMYPSMPFGFDISGELKENPSVDQMDFTAADIGWDIDFGTMDMEAFLSIDPNQMFNNGA